jgi:integrase
VPDDELGAYAHRWLEEDMEPRYDTTGNQYGGIVGDDLRQLRSRCTALQKYIGDVRLGQLDIERFHALRHAFTPLLRASGTRDRVAMTMTGHRDAAMLDYYDEGLESEQIDYESAPLQRLR